MLRGLPKTASLDDARVYEYEDEEGNVYWSFAQPMTLIPVARRLRARSRIGTHFINFVSALRHIAASFLRGG